jgi:predicted metal-binding transcription factor (methanogenesis marker protein 9)
VKKFFKILLQYKKVIALINLIKEAYKDKKITGDEAEKVLKEAIDMLVAMKILERNDEEKTAE